MDTVVFLRQSPTGQAGIATERRGDPSRCCGASMPTAAFHALRGMSVYREDGRVPEAPTAEYTAADLRQAHREGFVFGAAGLNTVGDEIPLATVLAAARRQLEECPENVEAQALVEYLERG